MAHSVRTIALKDIAEYLKDIQIRDEHGDVWVVTPHHLNSKEQTKLNKELGVSKVNYTPKAMNRK